MDKKLPRLVVDTNVIISAIISLEGVPAQILKALRKNKAVLLVSDAVVQEYLEVLEYPKIQKTRCGACKRPFVVSPDTYGTSGVTDRDQEKS